MRLSLPRNVLTLAAIGALLRLVACANGAATDTLGGDGTDEAGTPGPSDATVSEASADSDTGGPRADAGCPDGFTGPGCGTCTPGLHACGKTCAPTQSNFPEAGCALGCGEMCPSPGSGFATCSDAGTCDFGCPEGSILDGGSCGCPVGQRVCADGACHSCCAASDCPGHQMCGNGGTVGVCSGCLPGWGDCDGNPANGCETSLSSDNNCGRCGNSCCFGFFCCGFIGGETCSPSGASFACRC